MTLTNLVSCQMLKQLFLKLYVQMCVAAELAWSWKLPAVFAQRSNSQLPFNLLHFIHWPEFKTSLSPASKDLQNASEKTRSQRGREAERQD